MSVNWNYFYLWKSKITVKIKIFPIAIQIQSEISKPDKLLSDLSVLKRKFIISRWLKYFLELCCFYSQYGGGPSHRLSPDDCPLALQDAFLERLGYTNTTRRVRIGIDPELRHLLRFHTGPAMPHPGLKGLNKCGAVLVLKGLVFPQWRRRPIALLHSRLFLYPGNIFCGTGENCCLNLQHFNVWKERRFLCRLNVLKTEEKTAKTIADLLISRCPQIYSKRTFLL